ncbi:hypothetical protein ACFL2R_03455 [Patescibacteria group bacterium]
MSLEFVSMEKCPKDQNQWIITLKEKPIFFVKLLKRKGHLRRFRGSSTVWHELPNFERPGTLMELRLSEICEKEEYNRT